jgi:hypothetical protein
MRDPERHLKTLHHPNAASGGNMSIPSLGTFLADRRPGPEYMRSWTYCGMGSSMHRVLRMCRIRHQSGTVRLT